MDEREMLVARLYADMLQAVRDCGEVGLPAGLLFALVSAHLTLSEFEAWIGREVAAGRLREEGFTLVWTGDAPDTMH